MNEIRGNSRNLQAVCEERSGRRGSKSDTAQVMWVMVAATQEQYRCQAVCSSICHTLYTVFEWRGRKLGWAVTVWFFCDVLRPECQNFDRSIRRILHSLSCHSKTRSWLLGVGYQELVSNQLLHTYQCVNVYSNQLLRTYQCMSSNTHINYT